MDRICTVQIQGLTQQLRRTDQRRPAWEQTGYNNIDLGLLVET
jgi:hypothetical protein